MCAMGEVMELLERRGYRVGEREVALALDDLLPARDSDSTVSLAAADRDYLKRFSGAALVSPARAEELAARRVASATAEVVQALNRTEVAEQLGITPSRVSHRQADGHLYAFRAGPGKLRYPDWQFAADATIPHLPQVLGAMSADAPPWALRRFMLSADPDLIIDELEVSPRDWLLAGGDAEVVVGLAATLGDQA